MKTRLPNHITTIEEAKTFLKELYDNDETFHPEDDAHDIAWNLPDNLVPTHEECEKLNHLMDDIYDLPGNDGRHCGKMIFDPCEFLLNQDPEYVKMMHEDEAEYNKMTDNENV